MNADMLKKVKQGFLTASAVSVLLAAQGAVAGDESKAYKDQQTKADQHESMQHTESKTQSQGQSQASGQSQSQAPEFTEVDPDNDGEAKWSDLETAFQEELSEANWDEQMVLDQFDKDNDRALNADEYQRFQITLQAHAGADYAESDQQQAQQQGQQAGQEQQYEQQAQLEQEQQQTELEQQDQQAQEQQQAELEQGQQEQQAEIGQQEQQSEWEQEQAELEQDQQQQQAQLEQQEQEIQTGQQQDQQAQQDQEFQTGQQADQDFEQQQGQQAAGEVDSTLLSMPVTQVSQAEIVNSRGEEIGQVTRVVRDNTTGELALVVRSGGVLGFGGSSVLVDLAEVSQMDENQLLWDTMLGKDEISEMPEFDANEYTEISENEYSTLQEARDRG